MIAKLAAFQFVNNFSGLYYIAFGKSYVEGGGDFGLDTMEELAMQVSAMKLFEAV